MTKSELREFIIECVLSEYRPISTATGSLVEQKLSMRGVDKNVVFEGNIHAAHEYAISEGYNFIQDDSEFGGHYEGKTGIVYEFVGSTDYYAELAPKMTLKESFARLQGNAPKVMLEYNAPLVRKLFEFITTDECMEHIVGVVNSSFRLCTETELTTPRMIKEMWKPVIHNACIKMKECACKTVSEDIEVTESDINELTTKLVQHFSFDL